MASRAPIADIAAEKLSRHDARIAELETRLEREKAERARLAKAWGYQQGFKVAISPDQMRRALGR